MLSYLSSTYLQINDWMPEDWDCIEEVPDEIKDIWVPNSKIIPVKCFGTVSNEMRVCNSIGILTVYRHRLGGTFCHWWYDTRAVQGVMCIYMICNAQNLFPKMRILIPIWPDATNKWTSLTREFTLCPQTTQLRNKLGICIHNDVNSLIYSWKDLIAHIFHLYACFKSIKELSDICTDHMYVIYITPYTFSILLWLRRTQSPKNH